MLIYQLLSLRLPPTAWNEICTDEAVWRALALRLGYCQLERAAEERESGIRVVASVLQQFDREVEPDPAQNLLQATIQRYRSRNTTTYFDDCNSWLSLCCHLWRLGRHWSPSLLADVTDTLKPRPNKAPGPPDTDFKEADVSYLATRSSHVASLQDVTNPTPPPESYLFPYRRALHVMPEGSGVWRCKIDPDEKTFIVTGQNGGIQVFDHATKTLLWHIPRTATRSSPHLEFSRGWFIFDRPGIGHFEVWRSERLVPDLDRAPDRGHYQRYTILSSTRPIRAYRFQFPYLCAASQDGWITIWHVPQQQVVEEIDMRGSPHRDGNITYIDFDDEFVFLNGVGAKSVTVFSRQTKQLVWNMGQHFAAGAPAPATWRVREESYAEQGGEPYFSNPAFTQRRLVRAAPGPWQAGPNTMNLAQLTMTPYQIWSAVHPDLKTKTLLILGQGTVLLIKDYKKFFSNPEHAPDLFVEIEFQHLPDWYDDVVLDGGEDWSGLGWNSRRLWELRGDAQLTVHEGKAVIINELPYILDLNVESAALHTRHDHVEVNGVGRPESLPSHSSPSPSSSTHSHNEDAEEDNVNGEDNAGEQDPMPPVLVYSRASASRQDSYGRCSSVQMDDVGVYFTLDRDTIVHPLRTEVDEVHPEEWTGNDRVLLHLDFTRRYELQYDPYDYPRHFDLGFPDEDAETDENASL